MEKQNESRHCSIMLDCKRLKVSMSPQEICSYLSAAHPAADLAVYKVNLGVHSLVVFQGALTHRLLHFPQRLALDLADALTRDLHSTKSTMRGTSDAGACTNECAARTVLHRKKRRLSRRCRTAPARC